MAKQREIERVLSKYRERRLAESGGPLELHRAARERLFDVVEEQYGTDMSAVPEPGDNAEQFAKTLAWQSGMTRWWHRMIPQIGMAGTFAVAMLIIFLSMNRSGNEPQQARQLAPESAPARTKDFLSLPADSAKVGAADSPSAGAPDRDSEEAHQIIMEPQVDDTILADTSPAKNQALAAAAPAPTAAPPRKVAPTARSRDSVESLTAPAPAPKLKVRPTAELPAPSAPAPTASTDSSRVIPAGRAAAISFSAVPKSADRGGRAAPKPAPRPSAMRMAVADESEVEPAGPEKKLTLTRSQPIVVTLPPATQAPTPMKSVQPPGEMRSVTTQELKPAKRVAKPMIRTEPLPPPASLDVPAFEPLMPTSPASRTGQVAIESTRVPIPTVMTTPPSAPIVKRPVSGLPVVSPPAPSRPAPISSLQSQLLSDLRQTFEQSGSTDRFRRNLNSPPRQIPLKRFDLLVKGNSVTIRDGDGSIYNGTVKGMPSDADGSFAFEAKGTHRATRQTVSFTGRYVVSMPTSAAGSSAFYQRGNASRSAGSTPSASAARVIGKVVLAGRHTVDVKAAATR